MIVDCAVYQSGRRRADELPLTEVYESCAAEDTFAWIGLLEPDADEFDSVSREFELHELAVEDAINAHQRPKLEAYGDTLFLVLKTARWNAAEERIELGEIQVFVGRGFLVSVRHGEGTALHDVRLELEERPDLLRSGPGAALHAIVDRVVDDYGPVIEHLDHAIRTVEGDVFSAERSYPTERIFRLKRDVLELAAAIAPLAEPLDSLATGRHRHIDREIRPYFRDVQDHLQRQIGRVDGFRELLTSILAANLTQVSLALNVDVRRISAWAALVAVPTMIAGIYGMNFEYMPELEWRIGYPLVLAVIAIACTLLYRRFRRDGWL